MQLDEASEQYTLSLDDVYRHSLDVAKKYVDAPEYVSLYIRELLRNSGYLEQNDKNKVGELLQIVAENEERGRQGEQNEELERIRSFVEERDAALELQRASEEISFRKRIEEYYLPKQLVSAILEKGEIPTATAEQFVGIGFIDIADYTFLSKFLSPNENQTVLNGLYAAFNFVLNRHGGYLNKIEGDSLMFHFGGELDPNVHDMDRNQQERYIARELFYTCVEMQRVAFLFNQANDRFLYNEEPDTRSSISKAFEIIRTLRTSNELSPSINAFFQIRVRIGANIGEVTVGNFGPEGAKQWDVIGVPVIKAKRMESTAPVGGFRISEGFYEILKQNGTVDE